MWRRARQSDSKTRTREHTEDLLPHSPNTLNKLIIRKRLSYGARVSSPAKVGKCPGDNPSVVLNPSNLLQDIWPPIAVGPGLKNVESWEPGLGWAEGLGLEHD